MDVPPHLNHFAYHSEGGELAWPREQALEVISLATECGEAVLGVEIWLPTEPGPTIPTPFIYQQETSPLKPGEQWGAYVMRSNAHASKYIANFAWDVNDREHHSLEPYFNLTLTDRSGCGDAAG